MHALQALCVGAGHCLLPVLAALCQIPLSLPVFHSLRQFLRHCAARDPGQRSGAKQAQYAARYCALLYHHLRVLPGSCYHWLLGLWCHCAPLCGAQHDCALACVFAHPIATKNAHSLHSHHHCCCCHRHAQVYSFTGPQWGITLALALAIAQIAGCFQVH